MKRVNVHLTQNHVEQLKQLSQRTGLSVAEHVRRAIDIYIYLMGPSSGVTFSELVDVGKGFGLTREQLREALRRIAER